MPNSKAEMWKKDKKKFKDKALDDMWARRARKTAGMQLRKATPSELRRPRNHKESTIEGQKSLKKGK